MCEVPWPLIPQTATLMRSLEPMIFPEDFVPLIERSENRGLSDEGTSALSHNRELSRVLGLRNDWVLLDLRWVRQQ